MNSLNDYIQWQDKDITIFLDESGKTGTEVFKDGIWNFSSQPYFAICAVIIPDINIKMVSLRISEIKKKYFVQGELKSTKVKNNAKRKELITEIQQILKEYECELLFCIENKRFSVVKSIVDTVFFPFYEDDNDIKFFEKRALLKRTVANYIYRNITDNLLGEFCDLFDNDTYDEESLKILKMLCLKLYKQCLNQWIKNEIQNRVDYIDDYLTKDSYKIMDIQFIFPKRDTYNNGTSFIAISPQIDCFNYILNYVKNNYLYHSINVISDNVHDLKTSLGNYCNFLLHQNLQFENSRENEILQIADFFCGTIKKAIEEQLIQHVVNDKYLAELINVKNLTIVAPYEEQMSILKNNCNLKEEYLCYKDFFYVDERS